MRKRNLRLFLAQLPLANLYLSGAISWKEYLKRYKKLKCQKVKKIKKL